VAVIPRPKVSVEKRVTVRSKIFSAVPRHERDAAAIVDSVELARAEMRMDSPWDWMWDVAL